MASPKYSGDIRLKGKRTLLFPPLGRLLRLKPCELYFHSHVYNVIRVRINLQSIRNRENELIFCPGFTIIIRISLKDYFS